MNEFRLWQPGRAEDDPTLQPYLPAVGSTLHYALLYQPARSRAQLRLVESLREILTRLPLTSSSPEVAHAQLAWWYEALDSAATGSLLPRHPLLEALAPGFVSDPALAPAFRTLIEGIAKVQATTRFESVAAREQVWCELHGPLWDAHARLCGINAPEAQHAVRRLGGILALAEALLDLRRTIGAGLAFICRDRAPDTAALADGAHDAEWFAALARLEIPALVQELTIGLAGLPQSVALRRALRVQRVLVSVAQAALVELAREGGRVWEQRVDLTPVRKLWRALCVRVAG
jgi:phytoene synthase